MDQPVSRTLYELTWLDALEAKKQKHLYRRLHHTSFEKHSLLDFSSNDYLCLSSHPQVIEGAYLALKEYGAGVCSSRLISGGYLLLDMLEQELAAWYGKERSLVFPSGYQANIACFSTLLSPSSLVIADKYIHRSLIDGVRLSGAKLIRYPHADFSALERLLQKHQEPGRFVMCLTESVFSMQGTIIDVHKFCDLAKQYGALACIDDAHGFAVLPSCEKDRLSCADVIITTLSKAIGVQGGAILASASCVDYLVNQSSGFIYTTSISPAIVGGALASLRLLPTLELEREKLRWLAASFSKQASDLGLTTGSLPQAHIRPVYVGAPERALALQQQLRQKGLLVVAIRAPTVPPHQTLLRFSLSSGHTKEALDRLFDALRQLM